MEYASDEARRLVQTMRGCHHGRTWAVYCRDCEIVGLRQTYADSIRRARNAEQRLLAMGEDITAYENPTKSKEIG